MLNLALNCLLFSSRVSSNPAVEGCGVARLPGVENRVLYRKTPYIPLSSLQAPPEPWLVLRSGGCNQGPQRRFCSRWGLLHPLPSVSAKHGPDEFSPEPLSCRASSRSETKQQGRAAWRRGSWTVSRQQPPLCAPPQLDALCTSFHFTLASALQGGGDK